MSFTDEDLKRLKTMVLNCEAFYAMNTDVLPIRLSNLLSRLEAAEKVCLASEKDQLSHFEAQAGWASSEEVYHALRAWHEVIGE